MTDLSKEGAFPAQSPSFSERSNVSTNRAAWLSKLFFFVGIVGCVLVSVYILHQGLHSPSNDSWYPMERALQFLHAPRGGSVYHSLFFVEHVKFQYPLTALLPLDLLNAIGVTAWAQINTINAVVLIVLGVMFAAFCAKLLGPITIFGVRMPMVPLAFLVALLYFPDRLAFKLGQIQVFLDLLFLLSCLALVYERRLLAGCLIGASALVKPQFALFGLLALWRKGWRFVIGFFSVAIIFFVLSLLLYQFHNAIDYLSVLSFLSHHGEWQQMNQSVNGIMVRFLYHGPSLDRQVNGPIRQSALPPYIPAVYYATLVSSLLLIAIPFCIKSKSNDVLSTLTVFCIAGITFTMASPVAWTHHYGILLPGYVVALKLYLDSIRNGQTAKSLRSVGYVIGLAVSFLLTGFAMGDALGDTIPALNIEQSHVFFGACILIILLLVEHRRRAYASLGRKAV